MEAARKGGVLLQNEVQGKNKIKDQKRKEEKKRENIAQQKTQEENKKGRPTFGKITFF